MAPILPQVDSPKPMQRPTNDSKLPDRYFELSYNGRKLLYSFEIIGGQPQPVTGYPLIIGLHGGGTGINASENDGYWNDVVTRFYHDSVTAYHGDPSRGSVVLVCPRGISSGQEKGTNDAPADEWDLHFRPEAYVLMEKMIVGLLQPEPLELREYRKYRTDVKVPRLQSPNFVDPNRVILWGFSAGGDGAFRLGTKISDRFAAVVPAAGHPGNTRFANAANVVMLLEVGEDDLIPGKYAFQRAQVYLTMAEPRLKRLHGDLSSVDKEKYYRYHCYVVKNAHRNEPDRGGMSPKNYRKLVHGYWSQPGTISTKQSVLDYTKPLDTTTTKTVATEWLKQFETIPRDKIATLPTNIKDWPRVVLPDGCYGQPININPITLLENVKREPTPELVVWDLAWRPEEPKGSPQGWEKRFSYWLYLRTSSLPDEVKKQIDYSLKRDEQNDKSNLDYEPEKARYTPGSVANSIRIYRPNAYIGYLIKDSWLSKNIAIYVRDDNRPIWSGTVTPQAKIKAETLRAREDPNLQFSAMIYLEQTSDGAWDVKQAKGLDG